MTKKEFLSRWTVLQPIYEVKNGETVKHSIDDDLDEYGKYCAEQAYREGMNHGESGRYKDPEDWWNDFIKEENKEGQK